MQTHTHSPKNKKRIIWSLIGMAFSLQAQDELVENQKHEAMREEEGDPYNEENGEQVQTIYNSWLFRRGLQIRLIPGQ